MNPVVPVTVIVVAYNHASYVTELLESIENQTRQPCKVVMCDDASSDDTQQLMTAFSEATRIPTVLRFNEANIGLTATLNKALSEVETPYYAYISADDLMSPERLRLQVQMMFDNPDLSFVYSDAYRIDEFGRRAPRMFVSTNAAERSLSDTFACLLGGNWIPAASVLLKTQAVRSVGGYDESLFFEDHDLWLRLARKYAFKGHPDPLVSFRELSTSLGATRFRDEDTGWQRTKVEIYSKHFGINHEIDRAISDRIKPWLVTLAARGEEPTSLAPYFRRNARAHPSISNLMYAAVGSLLPRLLTFLARTRRSD